MINFTYDYTYLLDSWQHGKIAARFIRTDLKDMTHRFKMACGTRVQVPDYDIKSYTYKEPLEIIPDGYRTTYIQQEAPAEKQDSGSHGSYYRCTVLSKTTIDDRGSYEAEANDIIETLEMNFAEANGFKAIWRKAAARQGKGKKDNSPLYDAQKVLWAGQRLVAQES